MIRRLRALALALALALCATAGWAQQRQLVQNALDALRRSAAALDHKDAGKAAEVLAGMKTSVEALSGTFAVFRAHAEAAAKKREQELLSVIQQITRTFEAEQAAEKKLRELPGKIGILEGSHKTLETKRIDLDRQMAVFKEEVDFRNQCKSRFADGIFWSTRCTALGFADLFAGRVSHLNSDIERNNRERGQIWGELSNLRGELQRAQATLQQAQRDKPRLEAERAQLQAKEGGLRGAVVNLNDAVVFWEDIRTLVDSRLSSPIGTLQDKANRLVRRAQQTGQAPAFSSYDIKKIATFQDTLIEFARTLDDKTNVLLLPENGGPPATRCPPSTVSIKVNDAALAAGRARGAWSKTKPEDWQNWIGAARCASPAAIYYGKFPNAQECENRCIADPACTIWSYNSMYQGRTNPVWADSLQECWGGSSALNPNKTPPVWGGFLSGGIR